MGGTCSCDIQSSKLEVLISEFSNKPITKTLTGHSMKEEKFVAEGRDLHEQNFSTRFFKKNVQNRSKSSRNSSKKSRNLESFQVSLLRFVQGYSKDEDEDCDIVIEGELLKYRPGVSANYTPRWCRLTINGFAYYKTRWAATCSNRTPLAFIPLIQIKEINESSKRNNKQKLFQFELILYQEDELTKLSRATNGFTLRPSQILHEPVPENWWSVRQVEWYSAERRLLFADSQRDTVGNWVNALQNLVNSSEENLNYSNV